MAALDVVPDRLGGAVDLARGLIEALGSDPGERAGVVAFAGRGVVRCPLTENLGAVADALDRLRPGGVEPGGTDLGAGLRAARAAIDAERPEPADGRVIVLLSDGEDHPGTWEREIPPLKRLGVVVHAVALGDPDAGQTIPDSGDVGVLVRHGSPVQTRRRDEALRAIAEATGGMFLPIGLAKADLGALYRDRIRPMERSRREPTRRHSGTVERFPIPLAVGLGLVLISARPFPRHRSSVLFALALCTLAAGQGPTRDTARRASNRGDLAYRRGDYPAALAFYHRAAALDPGSPIPPFNAGAALFQLGRYEEARARYRVARTRTAPDSPLRTQVDYALGNASAALGEDREAVEHYDACLASWADGPRAEATRSDAEANRRFVLARLEPPPPGPSSPEESADAPSPGGDPTPGDDPADPGQRPDPSRDPDRPPSGPGDEDGGPSTGSGAPPEGETSPGRPGGDPSGVRTQSRLADTIAAIREARSRRPRIATPRSISSEGADW